MNIESRNVAWVGWLIASLFYAYQYILRVMPNVLLPEIMTKFQINAEQYGTFAGLYYIGYCVMHIPLGILLDRVGVRIVMPICVLLTLIGSSLLIYTDTWMYPLLGRVLVGVGSSAAILGLFKVIRQGFPENYFSRLVGISVTIGLMGALYGGRPMSTLFHNIGWEKGLLMILSTGFIFAFFMMFCLPKHNTAVVEKRHTSILQDFLSVILNKKVLLVSCLGGLMVGPLEGFADVWGAEFLKKAYHFSATEAPGLTSFIFLGMAIGAPLITYIADKTVSYYKIILLSAIVMGVSFLWIFSGKACGTSLTALFLLIGVACAYQILVIYKASTYVDENLVGVASACTNMVIMLFGFIFHKLIGYLVQLQWDGTMLDGIAFYTTKNILNALCIIPIGQFIAIIGFLPFLIKELRKTK